MDETPVTLDTESAPPDDLTQVRDIILASHPDIVPELVQGDSISALVSSIEPARAAFARVIESVPPPAPITIPAGGNTPVTIDIDSLPTSEKIRRGLASQR